MGAAAIHDALAAKLVSISGVAVAYADGTSGTANVKPWTSTIVTMPAVVVRRGTTTRTAGTMREVYAREWEADFYLPFIDSGSPNKWINSIDDKLLAEMRSDISLGGRVSFIRYMGSNPPVLREEGEGPGVIQYVVWTARFETEERVGATYSV